MSEKVLKEVPTNATQLYPTKKFYSLFCKDVRGYKYFDVTCSPRDDSSVRVLVVDSSGNIQKSRHTFARSFFLSGEAALKKRGQQGKEAVKKRYALHPNIVRSQNDGDQHHISAAALARLYGVSLGECVVWGDRNEGRNHDDFIHLYPNRNGNYTLSPPEIL